MGKGLFPATLDTHPQSPGRDAEERAHLAVAVPLRDEAPKLAARGRHGIPQAQEPRRRLDGAQALDGPGVVEPRRERLQVDVPIGMLAPQSIYRAPPGNT